MQVLRRRRFAISNLALSPASLPAGYTGLTYSQTLSASKGTAPYTYTVVGGALPTGLSLSSGGVISGTPTAQGTFTFGIRATDANGRHGQQTYRITVPSYISKIPALYGSSLIWFPALVDTSGTVVTDYSGNGRSGTYNNVTLADGTGPDGVACPTFNGTNSYVVPTANTLTGLNGGGVFNPYAITIAFWFRVSEGTYTVSRCIFSVGAAAANRFLSRRLNATTIDLYCQIGGVSWNPTFTAAYTSGEWAHCLITLSQAQDLARIYLNGVQVGADAAYPAGTWSGSLTAGLTQIAGTGGASYFPGNIIYPLLTNSFSTPAQAAAVATCP